MIETVDRNQYNNHYQLLQQFTIDWWPRKYDNLEILLQKFQDYKKYLLEQDWETPLILENAIRITQYHLKKINTSEATSNNINKVI